VFDGLLYGLSCNRIAKTEVLLENIKNKFGKIKKKMHGLSESTNSIHDNLAKSKKLVQDLN